MFTTKKLKSKPKCTSQVRETFNVKKSKKRIQLCVFVDKRYKCLYHPLKQKTINPNKLHLIEKSRGTRIPNFYKRNKFVNEKTVINWMVSMGIAVKRVSNNRYFIKNHLRNFSNVLLIANRKRIELGLSPFLVKGISDEY